MKKYFTSLKIADGKYTAIAYDPTNNQQVYSTQPYITQQQAVADLAEFLRTNQPPKNLNPVQHISKDNKSMSRILTTPAKKCCGG